MDHEALEEEAVGPLFRGVDLGGTSSSDEERVAREEAGGSWKSSHSPGTSK